MKVFITIVIIAIFMLVLRIYYEKQIEGFENNTSENDSDSDTEEEASSPPSPTQEPSEPEESSSIQYDDVKVDATDILKQINDIIPPELVNEISKRTSANILQPQGLESQSSTITKNTAPISEEHGELCNCDKCEKNIYIHQTFNNYKLDKPKSSKRKKPLNIRAGGLLSDDHENVNFFLNKIMTGLDKKYQGRNFQEFGTKIKPRKHSKPKYAKHESTTGMFTFTGPSPYNSHK
tara:strand:- start:582 stop:1286 length:705 start_codon:yes stop_codon:yes gene_type:complete